MARDKKTALERLEDLLEEKDGELAELRSKLEEIEDRESYRWTRHRRIPEEDDAPNLPVPRLQILLVPLSPDWYSWESQYSLVYRHFLGRADIGGEGDPNLLSVPLGITTTRGAGPPIRDGKIDTPFRDGTHIISDAEHLKLPMYIICEGKAQVIEPRNLDIKKGK